MEIVPEIHDNETFVYNLYLCSCVVIPKYTTSNTEIYF